MKYGSVCSGIEAASVAWHPLGWTPAWFAEIEPFPSAVLAHRFPAVPNLGDMTLIADRISAGEVPAPDILVGGTPCQAYSVAGLRGGLSDPRGALTIAYVRLADAIDSARSVRGQSPAIIVWENVPGVLSSKDNAFGCFLGGLAGESCELQPPGGRWSDAGCVYGPARTVAWRILDAQYFSLAQRRRRVFLVSSARDDTDPAEILFEFDGLRRDTPPSREAGEAAAADAAGGFVAGGAGSSAVGTDCYNGSITGDVACTMGTPGSSVNASGPTVMVCHGTQDLCVSDSTAFALGRNNGAENAVLANTSNTLYNKGFTQSETNNASSQEAHPGTLLRTLRKEVGEKTFAEWGLGILNSLQQKEILQQALHGLSIRPATFSRSWVVYCALSRQKDGSCWLMQSLQEAGCVRCSSHGWRPSKQLSGELGAYLSELSQPGTQASRFMRDLWQSSEGLGLLRQALSAIQEVGEPPCGKSKSAFTTMRVRRLTCEECEFLQGFPRGHTLVPHRGKPAADGPRYKALGNSMAVPVMRWIGERIQMVDQHNI